MAKRFYGPIISSTPGHVEDTIDYGIPYEPIKVLAPFIINLPVEVYQKMLAYAKLSKGEISGFGKTRRIINPTKIRTYEILNVTIFDQVVTSAHTELDQDALVKFYMGLITQNEKPERWNLWWHSHNDFATFFSGEDQATIANLSRETNLLSICINKKGEMVGRFDRHGECLSDTTDTEINIITPGLAETMELCRKEVKKKVKYETIKISTMKGVDRYDERDFGFHQTERLDIYRSGE